jgi:hypothetical protein
MPETAFEWIKKAVDNKIKNESNREKNARFLNFPMNARHFSHCLKVFLIDSIQ